MCQPVISLKLFEPHEQGIVLLDVLHEVLEITRFSSSVNKGPPRPGRLSFQR
jgi:hypothetical protein